MQHFGCELRDDKDARRVFAATFCGNCKHMQCLWAVAVMVRWGMVNMHVRGAHLLGTEGAGHTQEVGPELPAPPEANWCMAAVAPLPWQLPTKLSKAQGHGSRAHMLLCCHTVLGELEGCPAMCQLALLGAIWFWLPREMQGLRANQGCNICGPYNSLKRRKPSHKSQLMFASLLHFVL